MDKKLKAKWVKALRSGKYKQTTGRLMRGDGDQAAYCCLGVLLTVNKMPCKGATLSTEEKERVGLADTERLRLEHMNDGFQDEENNPMGKRHSFAEIADYIEKHL